MHDKLINFTLARYALVAVILAYFEHRSLEVSTQLGVTLSNKFLLENSKSQNLANYLV